MAASSNAHQLREAMDHFFTDDSELTRVVANLQPKDIQQVTNAYAKELNRDLLADIKKNTHGHYEDAIVALLTPLIKYDAQCLRKAMKGLGTDDKCLIEIICTRSHQELGQISEAYLNEFGHELHHDLEHETSGDLKKLLIHRLKNISEEKGDVDNDVKLLYEAGQGRLLGHDDQVFYNVLAHRGKEYTQALSVAYANKHNKSLPAIVEKELGGDFKRALVAIVTPTPTYLSNMLHEAMKGLGTDNSAVIRIIASQRGRHLKEIGAHYLATHDIPLKKRVSDECSGDYKKILVGVIEHQVEGVRIA